MNPKPISAIVAGSGTATAVTATKLVIVAVAAPPMQSVQFMNQPREFAACSVAALADRSPRIRQYGPRAVDEQAEEIAAGTGGVGRDVGPVERERIEAQAQRGVGDVGLAWA